MALSLNDEVNHLKFKHSGTKMTFKCTLCTKNYASKHGALCHMPKCKGSKEPTQEEALKCEVCGKTYKTKRGLSQHERHQHAEVRNEKRTAVAGGGVTRPRPTCYGQVWSKEEIDLMLRLEVELQHERNIASKMCPHLPGKTNKQVRDKRAEATYKARKAELLQAQVPADPTQETREEMTEVDIRIAEAAPQIPMSKEKQNAVVTPIPQIVVTDFSRPTRPEEDIWRKSIIQSSVKAKVGRITTTEEERQILGILGDALRYANEVDGLVPTEHIDYIYNTVVTYIKRQGAQVKAKPTRKRQKGTGKRGKKFRRYIYARTQELFNKDPGQLAKLVREDVSFWEVDSGQLPKSEIKKLYKDLWESTPEIEQPYTGQLGETESQLDLQTMIPNITRKEIRGRIARMKGSTAAGPDGVKREQITKASTQEILRLLYTLITVCGRQPTAWREN